MNTPEYLAYQSFLRVKAFNELYKPAFVKESPAAIAAEQLPKIVTRLAPFAKVRLGPEASGATEEKAVTIDELREDLKIRRRPL